MKTQYNIQVVGNKQLLENQAEYENKKIAIQKKSQEIQNALLKSGGEETADIERMRLELFKMESELPLESTEALEN